MRMTTLPPLVRVAAAVAALSLSSAAAAQKPTDAAKHSVYITGEVTIFDSQTLFVPPSNSSPVVLRNFVPEGSHVKAGDLVLRIETPTANNIEQLQAVVDQTRSKLDSEVAKLEVSALEAEKNLALAQAALAKAQVDAALPKTQIAPLDFDKYQTEKEKAERELEVRQLARKEALAAVRRRLEDGELDLRKQRIQLKFAKDELAQSEVRARQDGIVVHGFNPWRGERIEEGATVYPGNQAGQIMGSGKTGVKAWVLEADRVQLRENMRVKLSFDALPARQIESTITSISGAPEQRPNWGNGRYFRIDIALPANIQAQLTSGMSVRVEPVAQPNARTGTTSAPPELSLEGEIQSHLTTAVAPPTIPYIWQYTIAKIAEEGGSLKAGDVIVRFQAPEVMTKLNAQKSTLNEKQRALDKLKLEQAEAEKAASLAVAEAQANAEKAARKATMPKDLIRRVDYDKLLIDKALTAELTQIAVHLRDTQAKARKAERKTLDFEIAQSQSKIEVLEKGVLAMTVTAKRPGVLIYNNSFNGEKFTTGSQVWMGLSVATIADPDKLFVSAKVPEAQTPSIHVGQTARITIPGANQTLSARISKLGSVFHSKSNTQPSIVRDIELEFDAPPKSLKPGSAVQVMLGTPQGAQLLAKTADGKEKAQ